MAANDSSNFKTPENQGNPYVLAKAGKGLKGRQIIDVKRKYAVQAAIEDARLEQQVD